MNHQDLKNWRVAMGFSQAEAAEALGISKSSIENYERGARREDGRSVLIPLAVSLACSALYHRLQPWHLAPVNKALTKDVEKAKARKRSELMKSFVAGVDAEIKAAKP